ncbi:hypothetical protein F8568_019710 [Actinomadura sp. LD22]|uniref:DUF3995 domain-containing protein n=1 Tax=Actinomadura physcomitrii TaxID=2650748 RepID=A0A6I4MFQ1_9ACTN|nr:hypothetical protein [Actinomadura physcomitrii]MWA02561.1 hypothetical protein [Actinomadura physcomitrii]
MATSHGQSRTITPRAAWRGRLPLVALAWVTAYGGLRIYWAAGHRPARLSPIGTDLVVFTGWASAVLCGAAALVLAVLMLPAARALSRAPRLALIAAGWAVGAALTAAGAMLLLDVVGGILPGLGLGLHPLGALSRAACVAAGVMTGLSARAYARRTRAGCTGCGRTAGAPAAPSARTPRWAYGAAYLAIAGCAARIAAQAAVGFDWGRGVSGVLFLIGFVLGGTLLPLALVHRFGRRWPRSVPGLAGRAVPRRLVLWPGTALSAGLVVYFGLMLLQMIWERMHGRDPFPPDGRMDLPEAFFWVAVPGYLAWGAGLAAAALGYARGTRAPCRACGR